MTTTKRRNSSRPGMGHEDEDSADDEDVGSFYDGTSNRFDDDDDDSSSHAAASTLRRVTDANTRQVQRVRLLLIALFLMGAAVCTGTYFFVNNEAKNDYKLSFDLFVNALQATVMREADNLHDGVRNLGDTIVDSAVFARTTVNEDAAGRNDPAMNGNNSTMTPSSLNSTATTTTTTQFPFVTVSQFETHGEHARDRSKMEAILYAPLVTLTQRPTWESWSVDHQDWIETARRKFLSQVQADTARQEAQHDEDHDQEDDSSSNSNQPVYLEGSISPYIYQRRNDIFPEPSDGVVFDYDDHEDEEDGQEEEDDDDDADHHIFAPLWYLSPPPFNPAVVNLDLLQQQAYHELLLHVIATQHPSFSDVRSIEQFASLQVTDADHLAWHEQFTGRLPDGSVGYDQPHSLYAQAVRQHVGTENGDHHGHDDDDDDKVVGILLGFVAWDAYLSDLLPEGVQGIHVVLRSKCGMHSDHSQDEHGQGSEEHQSFTYILNGPVPTFLGPGDHHDRSYDKMERVVHFESNSHNSLHSDLRHDELGIESFCSYSFSVYPTATFEHQYDSNRALVASVTLGGTFLLVALAFFAYDGVVRRRNQRVTAEAEKSNAVVNSLFPEAIRDRILAANEHHDPRTTHLGGGRKNAISKAAAKSTAADGGLSASVLSRPIADHFPESTIMFADIRGFTAWSSSREPTQVFELLETLYSAFDAIAKRRRVFKVETVGDCYVAVCGVPNPNKDHAVVMARFAKDCLRTFQELVRELECTLGPDTGDLGLRAGLHSGPVTGGVLRGDRARFQLFGDSMNTASRIETNGMPNRIHCSQETADLLIAAGKGNWVIPREDKIVAKGKGELQTYWVQINVQADSSLNSNTSVHESDKEDEPDDSIDEFDAKMERLIDYNVAILQQFLKRIISTRAPTAQECAKRLTYQPTNDNSMPFEETADVIEFPQAPSSKYVDLNGLSLDPKVLGQLTSFVSSVAAMYRDNQYHNFEHASHVTMSIAKLLSRLTHTKCMAGLPSENANAEEQQTFPDVHNRTYGLSSDPLTQFAVVLSALIHDTDHRGVSNGTLMKENSSLAVAYKDRSVAEQNSFDLSWNLLMHEEYEDLRQTIYTTEEELKRFRQVMVNAVLATDMWDQDLISLRNERWAKAFDNPPGDDTQGTMNRRGTLLIEVLAQAADIAHTMQHWHIYRKWSQRLFLEMHAAYRAGRVQENPMDQWYQSQLDFFDNIVIPLAQKIKDSDALGVSGDECLTYAIQNKKEWEERGAKVVEEFKGLLPVERKLSM